MEDKAGEDALADARAAALESLRARHAPMSSGTNAILTRAADRLLDPDASPRSFERLKAQYAAEAETGDGQ
ncbi:MAG TPA: hypothetical protein VLQ65_07350 [Saliniramus sp.]|nr:hypothetical protein [Saliniramus sp.]